MLVTNVEQLSVGDRLISFMTVDMSTQLSNRNIPACIAVRISLPHNKLIVGVLSYRVALKLAALGRPLNVYFDEKLASFSNSVRWYEYGN